MKHKSYLTAIGRKALPAPTRWLKNNGFIQNNPFIPMLDFGCGKCHEVNNKFMVCDGYDPYHRPEGLTAGKQYCIIICNYVLCTLPADEQLPVLKSIQDLLTPYGVAYVTVRNDKPKQGSGLSSKGTYQSKVDLTLGLVHQNSQFKIYLLTKVSVLT